MGNEDGARFQQIAEIIKIMKRQGKVDETYFRSLGKMEPAEVQKIYDQVKAEADGDATVAISAPTEEQFEQKEEKVEETKKKSTRRTAKKSKPKKEEPKEVAGAAPKEEPKEEAPPEPTPEPAPAAASFDPEAFKNLFLEAATPLVERINKLEDTNKMLVAKLDALEASIQEAHAAATDANEKVNAIEAQPARTNGEIDLVAALDTLVEEKPYVFLNALACSTGYACDLAESDSE